MSWNSIYMLMTPKFISSLQTSLTNSTLGYTALYLTSPLGFLTDHFKFNMSNTEHLIFSKFALSTAFVISADGNLKIIVKAKTLESSWTPFFISLPTFNQMGTAVLRKYPESSQFTYTASTLISSHLGYSNLPLVCPCPYCLFSALQPKWAFSQRRPQRTPLLKVLQSLSVSLKVLRSGLQDPKWFGPLILSLSLLLPGMFHLGALLLLFPLPRWPFPAKPTTLTPLPPWCLFVRCWSSSHLPWLHIQNFNLPWPSCYPWTPLTCSTFSSNII